MENTEHKPHPNWYQPEAPHLSNEQAQEAYKQLIQYPKIVRDARDPAINGQEYVCESYILFDTPKQLPHGKVCYGYKKTRGVASTEVEATRLAKRIIKEVDSKNSVRIAPVGSWVPITSSDIFVKDMEDVKMQDGEVHLRDEAIKKKEEEMRRVQREIREREEELKNGKDIYDDKTSLRYYSMRRVTDLKVEQEIKRQMKQIESLQETLVEVRTELKKLDLVRPDYDSEWINCYNEERRKSGVPDYVPGEHSLTDYQNWKLPEEPQVPDYRVPESLQTAQENVQVETTQDTESINAECDETETRSVDV